MKSRHEEKPTYETEKLRPVAVAWYSDQAQWSKMRAISSDPDDFGTSYEVWVAEFERNLEKLRSGGSIPVQIEIDADGFSKWCATEQRPRDASARALYAAERMRTSASGGRS